MGRRENPIAPCGKALRALARWLRDRRATARLSYTELAQRTTALALPDGGSAGCSADTLARAVSGQGVPRLRTVIAYAAACGADRAEAERLWKRARYEATLPARQAEQPAPHITYVRDFAELRSALLDLYRKDGSRPYEELERASAGVLAHSTVARVINGSAARPAREFVMAFAQACGVRGGLALEAWGQAWDRAEERRLGRRPPAPRRKAPAGARYMDRQRNPDGQEVWVVNGRFNNDETLLQLKQQWETGGSTLSRRELDTARNVARRRHAARALVWMEGRREQATAIHRELVEARLLMS
ncbi:helix-turn-helix transcriptional regulator [Streptomyces sp. SAJ15]|uniref:helix-turn-helix domain-containing protein n=1 Tax=Streptomyces sp. SAJ15 TaxID=2011095 RepID=UPI0011867C9E|nr:helix-turn-helix transcriptional regulator [Streptomyces sp. SAJ15]TVL88495.1 hypothetical protein CD790_31145 [Streptomyces sp. SAJ15]